MDVSVDPRFSDLLARLFAGIDAPQPWESFLEALAEWLEATFATLIIAAPGRGLPGTFITPGADPDHARMYLGNYFTDDPFQNLPEGRVISFGEFIAGKPPGEHAAYREYLVLAGGEQVLAVDLRFGGQFEARFRATRTSDRPDFTARERARFQELVPHMRIAVGLFEKLQFANAQHGVFRSATDGLGLALLVLDRQGRIVSSNLLAERILAEGEALRRAGDTVRFEATALKQKVAELLSSGSDAGGVSRFRIPRPDHGDLVATARAIDLPAIHSGTGALALFLARPENDRVLDPEAIRDLLGVTPAEARLCAELAHGHSLVEAARLLGIAHNTAKAQLRSVFAKTQVHRQSQLMNLLGALSG